jgi:hypothetical protein
MNQHTEYLKDDEGNQLLSHYKITTNKFGQKITVPVVDIRDGIVYRMMATSMVKINNRSKWITPTEYHRSYKPKQHKHI